MLNAPFSDLSSVHISGEKLDGLDSTPESHKASQKRKRRRRKQNPDNKAYKPYRPRSYFKPGARGVISVMGAGTPDAKKAVVTSSQEDNEQTLLMTPDGKTNLLRSPQYQAGTPQTNGKRKLITPKKTTLVVSRVIQIHDKEINIYLPADKVKNQRLAVPAIPADTLADLHINQGSLEPIINIPITLADLKRADAQKSKARKSGVSVRYPQQSDVMGCAARTAMLKAGIQIPKRHAHWIHFMPHALNGNHTQKIINFGLGTKFCNAEMELVNPVIRKILNSKDHPETLYLSFYPQWVKGFEKIRLLDKLTVVIKDSPDEKPKHEVKFTFDALTQRRVCLSEIHIIEKLLLDTFKHKTKLANGEHLLSPYGITGLQARTAASASPYKPPVGSQRVDLLSPTRNFTPMSSLHAHKRQRLAPLNLDTVVAANEKLKKELRI